MTWQEQGYQAAREANERMRRQSDAYRSTTEPLQKINETLIEILGELRKLNRQLSNGSEV